MDAMKWVADMAKDHYSAFSIQASPERVHCLKSMGLNVILLLFEEGLSEVCTISYSYSKSASASFSSG